MRAPDSIPRLRSLRRWFLATFALIAPGLGAIVLVFGDGCAACPFLAVVPFFVLGAMLGTARCPRCAKTFFWGWEAGSNPLAESCRHCGLSLRQGISEDEPVDSRPEKRPD